MEASDIQQGRHEVSEIAGGAVASGILSDLLDHWRLLRGRAGMPRRADFDPMRVPKLLPSIFLFGLESDSGRFRVRVMGTRLCSLIGREITGQYLDEAALPDGLRLPLVARSASGMPFVVRGEADLPVAAGAGYEVLGLPLARADGEFGFLLGGMDFQVSGGERSPWTEGAAVRSRA